MPADRCALLIIKDRTFIGNDRNIALTDPRSIGYQTVHIGIHIQFGIRTVLGFVFVPGSTVQKSLSLDILIMDLFIGNCSNGYGGIGIIDPSRRCHLIGNGLIRQIIPAGLRSRGRAVIAVRGYISGFPAFPIGGGTRNTSAIIGVLTLISLLMRKHTFISSGICIIFFYCLLIIGEIHTQMAGHCRIVILLGSQQHLFYLIGDHGFCLVL